MDEIFGRFTPRITKLLSDEGLASLSFEQRPFKKPGLYAGGTVILADHLDELQSFRVAMHELGHAYRDLHHGPIYNYIMCKDLNGSPIGIEQAVDLVMREEYEATKWANEQLDKMGSKLRLKDYSGDPKNERARTPYRGMIEDVRKLGITTEAECIAFFIQKGEE